MKNIGFNIWDDYLEGEDTYGYIEEYKHLSEDQKQEIYELIFNAIKSFDGGVIYREFHVLNAGDQLEFQNLFYETKDSLINDLESLNLKYNGIPIVFYSES